MFDSKKVGAIIPAAGKGKRMGGTISKQLIELNGRPILLHSLEKFQTSNEVDVIVIVVEMENREKIYSLIHDYKLSKVKHIVIGGEERQDSVWEAMRVLNSEGIHLVIIHDAVRPFINGEQIHSILEIASEDGAVILAVQPKDTVKSSMENGYVAETLSRENLWLIQTPQAFQFSLLYQAYEQARKDNYYGTDDASLIERIGVKVRILNGSYDNIKITTPEDLDLAQIIAKRQLIHGT